MTFLRTQYNVVDGVDIEGVTENIKTITDFRISDVVGERLNEVKEEKEKLSKLKSITDSIVTYCKQNNTDWVILVTGAEGSGKSTLALKLAMLLDPAFEMKDQLVYTFNEEFGYLDFIGNFKNKPFRSVVFDEAVTALYAREGMKDEVKDAIKMFNMNRQLNHFTILVVPSYWSMDIDIRERRARSLIYVFQNQHNYVHYYAYYSRKKIPMISINKLARRYFLTPPAFLNTVKPSFIEHFPKMEKEFEKNYIKFKRNYFKEMFDDMKLKYKRKKEKELK